MHHRGAACSWRVKLAAPVFEFLPIEILCSYIDLRNVERIVASRTFLALNLRLNVTR